ncbi:chromosome-associated kinesin KIF4 [Trichonephila clavata]|uniref:Chromosome-associated kinesin KIF4 n=1 Tax=Trichonephila clavata TaxID=2740835 RepID=A0A8X6GDM0_TRICU|nr:chromosome-associated kinesin KIF4 [Trichonephila clavata]
MADCAICVAIRSRPLLKNETQCSESLSFESNSTVHLQNKTYTFDHVFPPGVSNEAVYNAIVAQKIQPLFEGYNVTILAYGPTGSGKTYTMGTDYNPQNTSNTDIGIIPRGIKEIFRIVKSQEQSTNFLIKVSFLELYREEIFDLLQKSATPCILREEPDGIKVIGLTEVPVKCVEDAFIVLEKGSHLRHTSTTAKNIKSSRSHAIFSVYIEQSNSVNSKRSKFQLVDLAGSERMGFSKTVGLQVKEGININLGLLSLGKVITHLIEEKQHIPYRDSKLTRLLQDSLGGNSHTVMIACVNPSASCTEETLSTLRYASNTRRIKNRPVVNIDSPSVQIEKLKKQVELLQNALLEYQSGCFGTVSDVSGERKEEFSKYEDMRDTYSKSVHLNILLNHRLSQAEEKNNFLFESLDALCEKIKIFIAELKKAIGIDPNLKVHLEKLQEIYDECLKLMDKEHVAQTSVDIEDNQQPTEIQSSCLEDSGDSINSNQESELEIQSLGDITEKQKIRTEALENISRTLSIKVDQVRNMENFYQNFDANVNEEYINSLVTQIQMLEKEKTNLQETVKESEDRVRTETQIKIEKYEQQITNLQNELRKKKIVLKAKEENQAKINQLQKEIKDLKRHKVQLVKQMKEDSNKFLQKQREKEREVAKLVREGRKKEHELVKLKNKFEREVNVLRQKIDRATSSKKKLAMQNKIKQTGIIKSRSSLEGVEEWICEEIKSKVCNGLAKVECEILEKEIESLKKQIRSIEELSNENPTAEDSGRDGPQVDSLKTVLQIMIEKIEAIRQTIKDENGSSCPVFDGFNSMAQAKVALESLFKKCVSAEIELGKQNEQLKKEQSISEHSEEKIKNLNQDIKNLKENFTTWELEQEEKIAAIKYDYENKIMSLLAEIQLNNKSSLASGGDPTLAERIEMQEKEIERLQYIHEDYDNKCKQVSMLQQQLFQAKKGKKATWLGNLTNNPSVALTSTSSLEDNKSISMVEEFLSDTGDESFGYDAKDPDWRLTPLEKIRKRKYQKPAKKRSHEESTSLNGDSSDSSPKKKILVGCQCRTNCRLKIKKKLLLQIAHISILMM